MAPNSTTSTTTKTTTECKDTKENYKNAILQVIFDQQSDYKNDKWEEFKIFWSTLKWFNIVLLTLLHAVFIYGVVTFPWLSSGKLILWEAFVIHVSGLGVGAGVHRLWCHRTYKAKYPLRMFLMLCYSMAGHNPIFNWVRDHRVHHKFTDTDADPHNSKRGFFFSHVGWLLVKKHPEVIRKGKEIDMSDVLNDPVIQIHEKYYVPLTIVLGFILPTIVPPFWWGQDWYWTIMATCVGRYVIVLNFTWFVNSIAHMWGTKPYDKEISPTENLTVSLMTFGEGWHNYHHAFPWDYKAAELPRYGVNGNAYFIDLFAKYGWAYDLKSASPELVRKIIEKWGDGSHPAFGSVEIPEAAELELRRTARKVIKKSDNGTRSVFETPETTEFQLRRSPHANSKKIS